MIAILGKLKTPRHIFCGLVAFLLCVLLTGSASAQASFKDRWFAPTSPWNIPIGTAAVTPYSSTTVQAFADTNHLNMNEWDIWTPPVLYGDSATDKTQNVTFKDGLGHTWTLPGVPIPASLIAYARYRLARSDTDGMTCLFDAHRKGFYSFWQTATDGQTISISTGGFSPLDGPGWSTYATHAPVQPIDTPSLGRASGANYCGGIIRASEMTAGHIDHALAVYWPVDLALGWRADKPLQYPATCTDGSSTDPARAVPYGARLQLDPSLADAQLLAMGLNTVDLVVAHALQQYGGYIVDTGPVAGIAFENLMRGNTNRYGATSTWPKVIYSHFRFVEPPAEMPLDTAASVGTPIP